MSLSSSSESQSSSSSSESISCSSSSESISNSSSSQSISNSSSSSSSSSLSSSSESTSISSSSCSSSISSSSNSESLSSSSSSQSESFSSSCSSSCSSESISKSSSSSSSESESLSSSSSSSQSISSCSSSSGYPTSWCIAWGEQNPGAGHTPEGWSTWSDGTGGNPTILGDPDWGQLQLVLNEVANSPIHHFGSLNSSVTVVSNINVGSVEVYYRQSATAFGQDDLAPAWVLKITGTIHLNQSYRQIRLKGA